MASDRQDQSGHGPLKSPEQKIRLSFDTRILLMTLLISLPGGVVAEIFLWTGHHSLELKWTVTFFIALAWAIGSSMLHGQVVRPMQTLSNMVAAIREEDFSIRLRGGGQFGQGGRFPVQGEPDGELGPPARPLCNPSGPV